MNTNNPDYKEKETFQEQWDKEESRWEEQQEIKYAEKEKQKDK